MVIITNIALGQDSKYILFDESKDSIITIGKNTFYKIDENLFDADRYKETDTVINGSFKYYTVKSLKTEGDKISNEYFVNLKEHATISLSKSGIETYNSLFNYIYIVKKISECNYKKTLVWWIDY